MFVNLVACFSNNDYIFIVMEYVEVRHRLRHRASPSDRSLHGPEPL